MKYFSSLAAFWSLMAICVASLARDHADKSAAQEAKPTKRFGDFGFLPHPRDYSGRVFKLSQDYPENLPKDENLPKFLRIDFKDWRNYILAVRKYCFLGNIHGGDVEDDWDVANQKPPRWFHMPWQHFGPNGREGIHGLTKEAAVKPRQLASTQAYPDGQTYAVAIFNEFGGYTIGKVWKDHEHPDPNRISFPPGTVICKLLFTDVPVDQVPWLDPPLQWQAYATDTFSSTNRRVRKLSLVQMDIMVRDPRSPYGWVFGTFQYNGKLKKDNAWENLVPVGLQWGNDPSITDDNSNPQPVKTRRNPKLKETVINESDEELPPTHLGWNSRLNGPVDNPMSSCMSCHSTAQAPAKSPILPIMLQPKPAPGSDKWMRWFRNIGCGQRFDEDKPTSSTDFSLQLALSLQNFYDWHNHKNGRNAEPYKHSATTVKAKVEPFNPFIILGETPDKDEYQILRDVPPK